MNVSIVFSFRNRDSLRVDRCLKSLSNQSFNDFEVIFIDYGSDIEFSNSIKDVINKYAFVKYYYSNTRGYPWNRSHALNMGVRLSNADYVLFGDVDLIYSPNSLATLMLNASTDVAVYSSIFFLDRIFSKWDSLYSIPLSHFKKSDDFPIGAVYLVNKAILFDICGFDENYCFWGVEDRDLKWRLEQKGLKHVPIDVDVAPIYHQWHPVVSNKRFNFFPDKWWDELNIYYQWNTTKLKRNNEAWGEFIIERPIFKATSVRIELNYFLINSYGKAQLIAEIIDCLQNLDSNECLHLIVRGIRYKSIYTKIIKVINFFLRRLNFPIGIDLLVNVDRDSFSYLPRDLFYVIWHLICKEQVALDYEFIDSENGLELKLLPKKIYCKKKRVT